MEDMNARLDGFERIARDMGVKPWTPGVMACKLWGGRTITTVWRHPADASFVDDVRIPMRADDDEATRIAQEAELRRGLGSHLRGRMLQEQRAGCRKMGRDRPRHAHLVVARGIREIKEDSEGEGQAACEYVKGSTDENSWCEAIVELGGVSFHQHGRNAYLLAPTTAPRTMLLAMAGERANDIVQHRWLEHDDLVVRKAMMVSGRLRLSLSFVWDIA